MDKDRLYRQRHPEKVKASQSQYYQKHKEIVNERRQTHYSKNREYILERMRNDTQECPICKMDFRRLYLKTHMLRHKLDVEKVNDLLCKPGDKKTVDDNHDISAHLYGSM